MEFQEESLYPHESYSSKPITICILPRLIFVLSRVKTITRDRICTKIWIQHKNSKEWRTHKNIEEEIEIWWKGNRLPLPSSSSYTNKRINPIILLFIKQARRCVSCPRITNIFTLELGLGYRQLTIINMT